MNGGLIFRAGMPEDIDGLRALAIQSYGQFRDVLGPAGWQELHAILQDREKQAALFRSSNCFVCVDAGNIVGMAYIVLSGHPWDVFEADWSSIRMVGVDPGYQGRGIAKKLTARCIDFAREKGEKIIALHTSEFMTAARHIYESMGFRMVREIPSRFGKKYWLYLLDLGQ